MIAIIHSGHTNYYHRHDHQNIKRNIVVVNDHVQDKSQSEMRARESLPARRGENRTE